MTTLAQFVRSPERDNDYVEACERAAKRLVKSLTVAHSIESDVIENAVLVTGANLYARRASMSELNNYQTGLPQPLPVRPSLDPLLQARHILAPYLGPGIA